MTHILQETLFVVMVIVQAIFTTRLMTAVRGPEANDLGENSFCYWTNKHLVHYWQRILGQIDRFFVVIYAFAKFNFEKTIFVLINFRTISKTYNKIVDLV